MKKLTSSGYWLLWATLVTTIGNGMQTLAVSKLLYDNTGSVWAFGGVLIFEQVLASFLQFVAGPWVDRGDPRKTCINVDTIRGVCVCLAGVAIGLGGESLIWILFMTFAIRLLHPFYRAATFSLGPSTVPVEALSRFNGYTNICLQGGQLLGLALAAPILQYWGSSLAFIVNGVSFLLSALMISFVKKQDISVPASPVSFSQIVSGWGEVAQILRKNVGFLFHLIIVAMDALAISFFNLMLVPFVENHFGGSSTWLSYLSGAFTVGAILSTPLVFQFEERFGPRTTAVLGLGGQALGFFLLAFSTIPGTSLFFSFLIGAANTISWTTLTTTLQSRSIGKIKGRIGTLRNVVIALFTIAFVPVLSRMQDPSDILVASGAICFAFFASIYVLGSERFLGKHFLVSQGAHGK